MQSKLASAGLCLVGIVLGCAAASVAPTNSARAGGPGWSCYATDQLDEPESAAQWRGAVTVSSGLNAVAQHTPPGTVVNLQWNAETSVTCVKN
jgi:hypothetical protein